ncbi:hypothetical protein DI09_11p170 [Mitosporidium daphniae]|uniref:Short chain dehydrogenase n=1 Tax=Mitosporidium daphniae TaxID=1485682 RepID=A0A098VVJ6_9MICR|nr:uncharacterized protein DI09_11p170 [Mitosporidium daphniae]KGG52972.1 hypothetical protein DI09_11p170 [Mitosporidium daphniae]|eukprot:XP_013239399.1 uncharacterized protein DI09_11p170 [Mitosporidium daphniae]
MSLKGQTVFITGASRGIGKSLALRFAREGANVAIVAKTIEPNPKLPGTIHDTAREVERLGGFSLPVACDIRFEDQIIAAIGATVKRFLLPRIDIVINNASAISLTKVQDTSAKAFDLMNGINVRGTYLVSKHAVPFLKKSRNPHILALCPPISLEKKWFAKHTAYTMSKYGMSMVIMGLSAELQSEVMLCLI